jgi:hypothetical protein
MRNSIITLDGTRPYIPSSSGFAKLPAGWDGAWPDNLPTGVYSSGPYTWTDPAVYYRKAIAGKDWVFKDETGIPSMVPYNILPKIIPNLVWDSKLPFPLNHSWGYHDAATGNGKWDLYYRETIKRYGEPESMEDFCNKMQLMNAIGYQGIFEAAGHKLNDIGGVMLWKLNAAFPSVVWQVYDFYLQPNAGYYFMQNACEPVHIQMNLVDHKVLVLNRTYKPVNNLTAVADVFSSDSKSLFHEEKSLSLTASDVKEASSLSEKLASLTGVNFVVLSLKNSAGAIISRNTYWLAKDGDYKSMSKMAKTSVQTTVLKSEPGKIDNRYSIKIENKTDKLAFFIRPQLLVDGEEVLPSLWSSNYFTLQPSASITVTVTCPSAQLKGKAPVLKVSGWNVNDQELSLPL